jgi:uncharacterized protein YecA (UPF0149 family)
MAILPAVCRQCNTFFPSGINVISESASFSGNIVGPCPKCGGMGQVPDGVFRLTLETIQILAAPNSTICELEKLRLLLEAAKSSHVTQSEIVKSIESEVPIFDSLKYLLPQNRAELYAFLALVLATIQLMVQQSPTPQSPPIQVTNTQVFNFITEKEKASPLRERRVSSKVGRNDACPCQSSKKYKKCCGQLK